MPPLPDISESEWTLMEALWESSPQTASELTKTLRPTINWAENTVRTLLTRLLGKGAAKPLLVHFAQNSKLTVAEVRELKRILDQSLKP